MNILDLIFGSADVSIPREGEPVVTKKPGKLEQIINNVKKIFDKPAQASTNPNAASGVWPSPLPTKTPATPTPSPSATPVPRNTPPPDKRAEPYYVQINDAARANNIPQDILYRLFRKESVGFNPYYVLGPGESPKGAQGIAQFIPSTAKSMGVTNPYDPEQAIPGGARYLKNKYDEFGDWPQALAAYNAGSGAVDKYGGIPPYNETMDYVFKILQGLGYGYGD